MNHHTPTFDTSHGGAEPTTWTEIGSSTNTSGWSLSVFSRAAVVLDAGSGSADSVTLTYDNVSVRGLL